MMPSEELDDPNGDRLKRNCVHQKRSGKDLVLRGGLLLHGWFFQFDQSADVGGMHHPSNFVAWA